jgi:CHASE3 domain sensor protein
MIIRRVALQIGVPTLLAVIACSAYLAVHHVYQTQQTAAVMLESSAIQTNIADVMKDLTDMEASQRGYLLTGDTSYLQPYSDAKTRIGKGLPELRTQLAKRNQDEQALEARLESLATSKQSEMERGIDLRERGYRHRAFRLVDTNEGKEYMDEIRGIASSLTLLEKSASVTLDKKRRTAFKKALSVTLMANAGLFVLAGCLVLMLRCEYRRLDQEVARSRRELDLRESQLLRLTSALSGQARSEIVAINTMSRLLVENYGGFLPRQGHEYAEQMNQAAIEIERLRQDLVGSIAYQGDGHAA